MCQSHLEEWYDIQTLIRILHFVIEFGSQKPKINK